MKKGKVLVQDRLRKGEGFACQYHMVAFGAW